MGCWGIPTGMARGIPLTLPYLKVRVPLAGHHHLLTDQLASSCQIQTWELHELPFATLVFGELRTSLGMEDGLCGTERD